MQDKVKTKTVPGLSEASAIEILRKVGPNLIPSESKSSPVKIFLQQLANPLVIVLIFVAVISLVFGELIDALLVSVVVIINSSLGFYQEFRAQRTLEKLQEMVRPICLVFRDGVRKEIEAEKLVPGDIVILSSGDRVPADGKVVSGNLLVNEAVLTGESEPIDKTNDNDVYTGTIVVSGTGLCRILETGTRTKFGQIGLSLQVIEKDETPLQKKLIKLSQQLALVVLFTCIFIFIFGVILQGRDFWEMFRISIILAAAAIPEGLPMATTIIMSLGMKRILKKKGLVKRLMSIETLGSTSVICTDKTGTITEGKMKVEKAMITDEQPTIMTMILNNNQRSGLEMALWEYAKEKGYDPQEIFDETERLKHHSFDSAKKYSSTEVSLDGEKTSLLMGAPDVIMHFCSLTEKERGLLHKQMEKEAVLGYRLLGFCYKKGRNLELHENYQWAGMVAVDDPIREDAPASLKRVLNAGIKVKLVSGDYLKTVEAIAQRIGLKSGGEYSLEGWEIDKMTLQELAKRIDKVNVFARVLPEHKLKIIEALKLNSEVVAMTGDGVNDAPALKQADIGIAMNEGTEVAKEVADLVLLDNSFEVIEAAIEEGRVVFDNTKKVVAYVLSNCFADIILIFLAMAFDLPTPLTILQILWIHIICDGPPDLMLGFESKEEDVWSRKPKFLQQEQIFDNKVRFLIAGISLLTGIISFVLFGFFYQKTGNLEIAQTIAFSTLAVVSLIYIFSFKNLHKSIFQSKLFDNGPLNLGVLYGVLLILAALYLPGLNEILGLSPIGIKDWAFVLVFCFALVVLIEVCEVLFSKREVLSRKLLDKADRTSYH